MYFCIHIYWTVQESSFRHDDNLEIRLMVFSFRWSFFYTLLLKPHPQANNILQLNLAEIIERAHSEINITEVVVRVKSREV